MAVTVEKVMGKPVVIVTYSGKVTVDDARQSYQDVATLMDDYGDRLYKIVNVDCDKAHASFDEVMMLTTLSSKGIRGSATDRNLHMVLVGQHLLIDLYVDAMRQEAFGAVEIPIFSTLQEAEIYVTEHMHQQGTWGSV